MGTLLLLLPLLTDGIQTLLNAFNKSGDAAVVGAGEQLAVSILQQTATIKGLTIDWTDPKAVLAYVQTLPAFVPIPDPAAPSAAS